MTSVQNPTGHGGADCRAAANAAAGQGGGLVPFKTSQGNTLTVNLSPSAVAERRVKRLKRSVWASGHLHGMAEKGFRASKCWFVTLTYRGVSDWKADHISKAVEKFRQFCRRACIPCRYTWVAELQGRGAVHYHLLAWLPVGVSMPHWDKPRGKRPAFWPHGMSNTQIAKSGVGYLMKYLSKLGELTRFPKGLRLYAIGGLSAQGRAVRSWYNLPGWAKLSYGVGQLKRVGSSLLDLATGEILQPAYSVSIGAAELVLKLLRPLPERFHDGAYSSVRFS